VSPLGTPATIWPVVPSALDDGDECGAVIGMIGKGNRNTWRKPAPVPFGPPQIPHGLTFGLNPDCLGTNLMLYNWAALEMGNRC
jgi:hypothetical protein